MNLQFNGRVLLNEEVGEIKNDREQRGLCATIKSHRFFIRS